MPSVDCIVETDISTSIRARQICGLFDVPPTEKCTLSWKVDVPIEDREWNVGLIMGPSGSGKSTIAKYLWPEQMAHTLEWKEKSVIDDFDAELNVEAISKTCGAVGFNTIPAWLRPYHVLSNGEKFRVELARTLLEAKDVAVIDEFTSVVDRQVAKIGSHAVQKYIRRNNKQFVAVSCHSDIIDWLQPDWILNASTCQFTWRSLRQRPELEYEIRKVHHSAWSIFAPFHYMSANLSRAAQCYGLFINDQIVSFVGILHKPNKDRGWKAISRVVTLPDWQGLGLAFVLINYVSSAYAAIGWRVRNYPAHPSFIRSHKRSKVWKNCGQSFQTNAKPGSKSSGKKRNSQMLAAARQSMRTPWRFEYRGPKLDKVSAMRLINNG